jgi:hypothetical protein
MTTNGSKKDLLKQIRQRRYLNKDFDGMRNDLLQYARTYFPNNIQDFSEASLGGLLLDLAAYVGDVQSFYLDHQYFETFPETSVEFDNIERHLRKAGVPIVGAAPAVVDVTFFIRVPASTDGLEPLNAALPVIKQNTILRAGNGVEFILTENIDFGARDRTGKLLATIEIGAKNQNNVPQNYILSRTGLCISGKETSESFSLGNFEAFKKINLSNPSVTEIVNVTDGLGNAYYEVEYLTQDTVYKGIINVGYDDNLVAENLVPIPAPYRFTKQVNLQTRGTSLILGGGSAATLNDDIIPDPSEFALPLYGKKSLSRVSINPGNLLQTTTFGVVSQNTTLNVTYRYGGGLSHNVDAGAINTVSVLNIEFPRSPASNIAAFVRNSVDVNNQTPASGGDEAPTVNTLKSKIPAYQATQGRIVTKEDLLARVYTLPSNFGRIFRASVQTNPNNPLAAQMFVICRNTDGVLIPASDTLKKNLSVYLNEYRMISDAIDILDARVINIQISFKVVIDPTQNKELTLQNVLSRVRDYINNSNINIDQPIIINDVQNVIYNTPGVITVVGIEFKNIYGAVDNRTYSNQVFNINSFTKKGIIFGPPGSIFEVKYPNYDIVGIAV